MILKITLILIVIVAVSYLIKHISIKKEPADENYQSITFENKFKVTEIIDGNTFKVEPGWKWNGKKGDTIRPMGYDTLEKGESGFDKTTAKLKGLLLDQEVELKNPIKLSYARLLCNVYFENKRLSDFFSEYLVRKDESATRDA